MKSKKISLFPDIQANHLKSLRNRRWYFVMASFFLLCELLMLFSNRSAFFSSEIMSFLFPHFFNLFLVTLLLIRGIKATRKDQELFVAFEDEKLSFRTQPGGEVHTILYQQIESIKMHTLGTYFHLKDGKKRYLTWEEADFDDIQELKSILLELQVKVGEAFWEEETDL
ncbi:hypothetical protein WJR50_11990 [Catalinimonas sp. 4WD22]|uniref:hypothetical protein n=1 Tax=Catalinimonas locisalis TaxID=3133978 RepID=UPI00310190A8